ncbi:ABC transporter ATP-binding protein [Nocardioides insulae]|uniref:ABC transporter ATP-binding protein n=1 Tax=Nocardioides insulae TaxID=394734 RepID=UPI000415C247|nr:ABC transporter ATP-binding protein [Nocardioides insulae]
MSLTAQGVSWSIDGHRVVDGVGLEVAPGTTMGLLGPNGSGKSSLLRLLAGLRAPAEGSIRLGGDDLADLPRRDIARRLALVEQDVNTDQDPLVREVIDLGRIPHRRRWSGESRSDRAAVLRAAQVTGVTEHLERRYSTLSGGERQRTQIARALAQEPTVLLLDEPTNHLDIRHQLSLLGMVRRAPATVVMALHDLNLALEFCDVVVVLESGRVAAAGPPAEVVDPALIEEVYGVPARVVQDEDGLHVRFLAAGEQSPSPAG